MTVHPNRPPSRIYTVLAVGIALSTFFVCCWRATLPTNEHRELDTFRQRTWAGKTVEEFVADHYDDSVTLVTASNFARDGFLRTHFLPNRGRFPLLSLWDYTSTQCETAWAAHDVQRYVNPYGRWVDVPSLNNDCIYAHYPPLADWVYGAMAGVGLNRLLHYRLLAVALNSTLLWVLYAWLRREVSEAAALTTLLLTATLPAFFHWSDATYYHPLHYLLLFAGILTWTLYWSDGRQRWFIATWFLFLLESLASYQLLLFYGIMVSGLTLLAQRRPYRTRLQVLTLLATAPLAGLLLHFGMRISLVGWDATWANAVGTFHARSVQGISPWTLASILRRYREHILRFDLTVLSLLSVSLSRILLQHELKRSLSILGLLLLGGISFAAVFPGTTLDHYWMMYRHPMPFAIYLLALVSESLIRLIKTMRTPQQPGHAHHGGPMYPRLALMGACVLPLGWVAQRNVAALWENTRLHASRTPHGVAGNLARQYLEVVHWTESTLHPAPGRPWLLVDGRRSVFPRNPNLVYTVSPNLISHIEIWWLDPVQLRRIRVLTDANTVSIFRATCSLTSFDGKQFEDLPGPGGFDVRPFVPEPGEPPAPEYRWAEYSLPHAVATRAMRLTCREPAAAIPLHEVAVH